MLNPVGTDWRYFLQDADGQLHIRLMVGLLGEEQANLLAERNAKALLVSQSLSESLKADMQVSSDVSSLSNSPFA